MIIAGHLKDFAMPIYIKGHIPYKDISDKGRITITPKEDSTGVIFDKCFCEVNFILPDINQEANYKLDGIERDACKLLKNGFAGSYEGQHYNLTYQHRSREEDTGLKSHYVHIQLLFEILNIL